MHYRSKQRAAIHLKPDLCADWQRATGDDAQSSTGDIGDLDPEGRTPPAIFQQFESAGQTYGESRMSPPYSAHQAAYRRIVGEALGQIAFPVARVLASSPPGTTAEVRSPHAANYTRMRMIVDFSSSTVAGYFEPAIFLPAVPYAPGFSVSMNA